MRLTVAVLALSLAVLAAVGPASGHFQTGKYTWNGCEADSRRVDPINMLFYGSAAASQALEQIEVHAGWTDTSGSTQYFKTHGSCGAMAGQRASNGSVSSRFHIRVRGTGEAEGIGQTSVGDAHHEDITIQGHSVDANGDQGSGFDQGRRELRREFQRAGHPWTRVYWGNTRNFRQPDGDEAGSDGWVVAVRIHSFDH